MTRYYIKDYLVHYGVSGMKWGNRRLQYQDGSLTPEGRIHYGYGEGRHNKTLQTLVTAGKVKLSDVPNYKSGLGLIPINGELHITADNNLNDYTSQEVLVGTTPDENGNYDYVDYNSILKDPETRAAVSLDNASPEEKEAHENGQITDYDLQSSNPNWGANGTNNNCTMNSAALEMMKHGIACQAGRSNEGEYDDCMSWWFDGAQRYHSDYDSAQDTIESFGPKSSGSISIRYPDGNGHSMHWTVDNDGGFQIQDGQANRRFDSIDDMCNTYGADKDQGFNIYRLDQATPNYDHMAEDGVLRAPNGTDNDESRSMVRDKTDGKLYGDY